MIEYYILNNNDINFGGFIGNLFKQCCNENNHKEIKSIYKDILDAQN